MRRSLTALVLSGRKTATAGLLRHDYEMEHEDLEHVGEELVVVDDDGQPVAVIVTDSVEVVGFDAVAWEFADAEGEGFDSIEDWRTGHLAYWQREGIAVTGTTQVVCLRFHVADGEVLGPLPLDQGTERSL
jgi:uncharacterized protein YhfF